MGKMIRLWTIALGDPVLAFRILQSISIYQSLRFNWWTSFFIYFVGYFSLFSIFLGFNVSSLGGFVFFLAFFLLITFTLIKNYFYTLMISYRRKELISFQDVALMSTLSDIPIFLGLPLIYVASFWISGSIIFIAVVGFTYFLLNNRRKLFQHIYQVPAKFVYLVSFSLWITIFAILLFFSIYLGVSFQLLVAQILS